MPAEARELAFGGAQPVLPGEEVLDVLRAHAVGHDDGDEGIRGPRAATENLLGAGPIEIPLTRGQSILPGARC